MVGKSTGRSMLVLPRTFLFPKQRTLKHPFPSGAVLSVSCWLFLQASPFNWAALTVVLSIPLFNIFGGKTWLFTFSQATRLF